MFVINLRLVPFKHSLMLADKAWMKLHSGRLWPYTQTLNLAEKACQEQIHLLITNINKLTHNNFTLRPGFNAIFFFVINAIAI
jgi:hypothetical protein